MSTLKTNTIENVAGTASVLVEDLEFKSPDGSIWILTVSDAGVVTMVKKT